MMDIDTRLKRLRYRSWHRGCKETDLILGRFADEGLASLDPKLLDTFEKLLDEDDADIWQWLIGAPAPAEYESLLSLLKQGANAA